MHQLNARKGSVPRRWNAELAGYVWLPRMIDKGRAHLAGAVGEYMFNSPLDFVFLRFVGFTGAELLDLIAGESEDARIAEAVHARAGKTPDEQAAFLRRFRRTWGATLAIMDLDEGHTKLTPFTALMVPFFALQVVVVMGLVIPFWRLCFTVRRPA